MNPKTILITGSTSGIGNAGAELLARLGWRVLVHARSEARGRPAVEDLKKRVPDGLFELVTGDLSDLRQVAALAAQVQLRAPVLDVLWNNAGLMLTRPRTSADGFEYQWAVNHLAGFLLTSRLLPALQAAPQARIIQTSSLAHHVGKVPGPRSFYPPEGKYDGWATYGNTKLANILFTRELAQRLSSTKITVHAFHPGYVRTAFGSGGNPGQGNAASWLAFLQIPVEKGAETGVFLATAEVPGHRSGLYWSSKKVRQGSRRINDANALLLWELTEKALEGPVSGF